MCGPYQTYTLHSEVIQMKHFAVAKMVKTDCRAHITVSNFIFRILLFQANSNHFNKTQKWRSIKISSRNS
jgi:hypothetical protein